MLNISNAVQPVFNLVNSPRILVSHLHIELKVGACKNLEEFGPKFLEEFGSIFLEELGPKFLEKFGPIFFRGVWISPLAARRCPSL